MTLLRCPSCHSSDQLGTIEELEGIARCNEIRDDGPDWSGDTEVIYDSSLTVGVACSCGWEFRGDDWMQHLEKA